jgi:hypothetical protein
MGRAYPRFLLSKSTQAKSKGTFVIHTLDPQFIGELSFNDARQITDVHVIEAFHQGTYYYNKACEIAEKEIPNWWKYSGIHDSCDLRDKLIAGLSKLPFITNYKEHFTVEEAREIMKIAYTGRAKNLYYDVNTYGIKHDFERISTLFNKTGQSKYCSNDTIKEALELEGFKTKTDKTGSPNLIANFVESEVNRLRKIGFYSVNNQSTHGFFVP